jgi:hypothetical protein
MCLGDGVGQSLKFFHIIGNKPTNNTTRPKEVNMEQIVGLSMREREARGNVSRVRKDFDRDLTQSLKIVGAVDPMTGRYLDRNGPSRQAWVAHRARQWYATFESSSKREPTHSEYFEHLQKLQKESYAAVQEELEEGVPQSQVDANKPVDPKAKPTAPPTQPSGKRQTDDPDVRQRLEKMKQRQQKS